MIWSQAWGLCGNGALFQSIHVLLFDRPVSISVSTPTFHVFSDLLPRYLFDKLVQSNVINLTIREQEIGGRLREVVDCIEEYLDLQLLALAFLPIIQTAHLPLSPFWFSQSGFPWLC